VIRATGLTRRVVLEAAGVVLLPLAARAQQTVMPVIGYLSDTSLGPSEARLAAFRQGLGDTGWVEGRNVAIEYRWAEGRYDQLPAMAGNLVARRVDVIVATALPSIRAAKNATSTIPIAFITGDPVGDGVVASLARPGGNLTGVSILAVEINAKRLELLSALVPHARVMGMLVNPDYPNTKRKVPELLEAAQAKGVDLHIVEATTEDQIDAAFDALARLRSGALVVDGDPFLGSRREQIIALATRYAMPAIYTAREYADSGGLLSYGPSLNTIFRQLGLYTGKILNGANPSDLPVQQPTKLELVVNLRTANALGLTVPQSLFARADEVIE
jgi:putative tryptophan/tyrosine transport system substrate-binding protein